MISLQAIPIPPIPLLPLVPDPLRRIRVPRDLDTVTARSDEVTDLDALGMTATGIERIWAGVERLYRSGFYPAIALCVRRHGQVVLDRAIGHARGNGPSDREDAARTPATPETPFVIFSASKAMTAVVAHLLDERGLLHVGDRVCEYIPEYATHGKEAITIEHLLSRHVAIHGPANKGYGQPGVKPGWRPIRECESGDEQGSWGNQPSHMSLTRLVDHAGPSAHGAPRAAPRPPCRPPAAPTATQRCPLTDAPP